ncbi:hypothetical protein Bhyg_06446 [Pseudolycoriella hygida]|uniref:Tyr recombinase domain-containing protein n=1 Tax=Pseudolycoriella hygida TaxID=35572 RepID=A0A9Q0N1Y1_9DIPT|nr:hypothetical protein Bhyg_06446 [Pseudolycoriella hygida]
MSIHRENVYGHSMRRSSASILANLGASMEGIMNAGGWSSMRTAQGYLGESLHYKNKTAEMITSTITTKSIISEPPGRLSSSIESTATIAS